MMFPSQLINRFMVHGLVATLFCVFLVDLHKQMVSASCSLQPLRLRLTRAKMRRKISSRLQSLLRYTSSSLNSLLIFTKSLSCSLSYKKFCFSSSSVGDVGDWFLDGAGDGPLMERVGSAASSFLGVFFVLLRFLCDDDMDGSRWHSTSSIFSCCREFRASSLSQILFEGFSEKRRCGEIKRQKRCLRGSSRRGGGGDELTFWLPAGMFSALFAFRQRTLCEP